jgi:DNA-binding response OmpR family regulator
MFKILIIDDDPAMTDLLKIILNTTGAELSTANSGMEGILAAQSKQPDIIILDLMMAGVDGWQVCKSIRQFSKIPILVLSALDSPGVVAHALETGADDYLVKPVPARVLIAHLQSLLKRRAGLPLMAAISVQEA